MHFCKQCGSNLKESAAFCHKCGVPVIAAREHIQMPSLQTNSKPYNRQSTYAFIWLAVTLLFLICALLPFIIEIDMFEGGGAMVFIGLIMFITGAIVTPLFFKRAKRFNEIVSGKNVILHWSYKPEEWARYTQEEFTRRKNQSWGLFVIIVSIMFVVNLVLAFVLEDAVGIMIVLFLGMTTILAITAWLSYTIPNKRNIKQIGEAIIARDGVYLNGAIHIWKGMSARFERVYLDENDTILVFVYSAMVQYGRREEYSVNVPVPKGRLSEAFNVITYFSKK